MIKNNMNLSLRKRKVRYLQEQQRELKGIPIRREEINYGTAKVKRVALKGIPIRREEINYGTAKVKRVANKRMKVKPKKIVEIIKESNPIKKEKLKRLKEQTLKLKKLPPRKLNKRMFY